MDIRRDFAANQQRRRRASGLQVRWTYLTNVCQNQQLAAAPEMLRPVQTDVDVHVRYRSPQHSGGVQDVLRGAAEDLRPLEDEHPDRRLNGDWPGSTEPRAGER